MCYFVRFRGQSGHWIYEYTPKRSPLVPSHRAPQFYDGRRGKRFTRLKFGEFASSSRAARQHRGAARARSHPSIEKKSIPRNAIADGANSAATCASAQGNHLGFADKEAATPTNGARADSLAYERRIQKCRGLRGGKREQRSRECERKSNFSHTHPPSLVTAAEDRTIAARIVLRGGHEIPRTCPEIEKNARQDSPSAP